MYLFDVPCDSDIWPPVTSAIRFPHTDQAATDSIAERLTLKPPTIAATTSRSPTTRLFSHQGSSAQTDASLVPSFRPYSEIQRQQEPLRSSQAVEQGAPECCTDRSSPYILRFVLGKTG